MNSFLLLAYTPAPMALSGNGKLAAAIILGMVCGFVLLKSDLIWRKSVLDFLTLKNGRILKTVLLWLAAGTLLFFYARTSGFVAVNVRGGYFWASVCGGILSGVGLVFCAFTPLNAVAALGSGRFYTVWALLGMFLAFPAVHLVSGFLSRSIYSWSDVKYVPPTPERFLAIDNPGLFIVAIAVFLILLVHFTVGDSEE